ncbi:MAG: HAD hydrolase family protein, partial [Ruminococcus sp.]
MTSLNTQYSGRKIYFFPPPADKGKAVRKFAENYNFDFIVSAGDSSIDFPMLEIADISIVPCEISEKIKNPNIKICPDNMIFSDFILESVLSL